MAVTVWFTVQKLVYTYPYEAPVTGTPPKKRRFSLVFGDFWAVGLNI